MRLVFAPLVFSLSVSALVLRGSQQCVQLQASGGASGTLGQLSDGQNRIGGSLPPACYCLNSGGFSDSSGRGCILTPPTTQFQCDSGASAATGFSISSSGEITYNGNSKFYACPANDNGEYNVYTQPVSGQSKCVEISLKAGGSCGASSSLTPTPSQSATPTNSACPSNLNGNYQFPHLIVPVNLQSPSTAYGTSYFGEANSTVCSIFNFDIPPSYSGTTCTLIFLLPAQSQLQTSSYNISGSSCLEFSKCDSAATQGTTWDNKPKCNEIGSWSVAPGNAYSIMTGSCEAGKTVTYEMCATGSFALRYFQDYNASPIGLYIRQC